MAKQKKNIENKTKITKRIYKDPKDAKPGYTSKREGLIEELGSGSLQAETEIDRDLESDS